MIKFNYLPLLISICASSYINASAQKKDLTIQDAVLGLRTGQLVPDNLKQVNWKNTSDVFTHIVSQNNNSFLIAQQASNNKIDTILSLKQINQLLFKKDSLKTFPLYSWSGNDNLIIEHKNKNYFLEYNLREWKIVTTNEIPENATNRTWNKDKSMYAYTIKNNLYIKNNQHKHIPISNENNPHIIYGQSVHRNEFGINGGIFFSPESNYLAFYRMDESMVENYPIINWSTIPATVENIKYPMSGRRSHEVSIGVYNIINNKTHFLQIDGPKDQYLTNVTWSPDERYIFVGVLNRAQNHLKWNQYDAKTGAFIKTLFEEKNEKYVEPQHPLYFLNKDEFVWLSQRDGYMHIYKYHISGKLINQLTKGKWVVNSILGYDKTNNNLIISANKKDPREKHIYTLNVINGNLNIINNEAGIHNGILNANGKYILDVHQNSSTPKMIALVNTSTKKSKTILNASNKLNAYQTAVVENVTLKANDNTTLYGKLIKPHDFDASRKYPVIVYLYNGPHLQLITNSYPESGNLWYDYMTQKGYLIFTMDGRGSSNRGFEFESATFRQLGQIEMKDQLVGVDFLKSLPYVDANRLGVHGWSFGGFMTTSLMLHYPNVFKVGVAGGPVIDWSMYEVMYTERYMDNPSENTEGYTLTELSSKVDKLNGKLLMIHGADDDVVVWQHSLKFIEASVKKNKQVDYYAYPGHKHNVLGNDRVHLMQKISDYFIQNL